MKKFLVKFLIVVVLLGALFIVFNFYSYIFKKRVSGEVLEVERVTQPTTIIGSSTTEAQMYSYAIMMRDKSGEIFTASSEDRQWSVIRKGRCVEADLYPYPPWELAKGGTYHGARAVKIYDCPPGTTLDEVKPAASVSPEPAAEKAAKVPENAPAPTPASASAPPAATP